MAQIQCIRLADLCDDAFELLSYQMNETAWSWRLLGTTCVYMYACRESQPTGHTTRNLPRKSSITAKMNTDAIVIVSAARTPIGKLKIASWYFPHDAEHFVTLATNGRASCGRLTTDYTKKNSPLSLIPELLRWSWWKIVCLLWLHIVKVCVLFILIG